jgi:uncharacterized membrane protein
MTSYFAVPPGGGESNLSYALATLAALTALWFILLVLVVIDLARGRNYWFEWAALVLVPVAGIGVLFATDYPGDRLCSLSIVTLPLVVGFYLFAGTLRHHRPSPAVGWARALALLLMLVLAAYPIARFAS